MPSATKTRTKSDAPADQQENLNLDAPVDPSEEPTETPAPAVDESSVDIEDDAKDWAWANDQIQQLQAALDSTEARLHELEQCTNVAPFCNYSVGTVRECKVLTNEDGEPWAVKIPVRFSVGVNKNLLDKNIPEDAEADWYNAPVFPSGKDPFFIYKGEDLLELAGLINSSNWVTLGLQWKHTWSTRNKPVRHPQTPTSKEWIGLTHPADNTIQSFEVIKTEPKDDQEIPY